VLAALKKRATDMEYAKLRAALEEIEAHRKALDQAAASIQRLLENSAQHAEITYPMVTDTSIAGTPGEKSYIDEAVEVLRAHGKPIRQRVLADQIQRRRPEAGRASIESSIFRHLAKAKVKRIIRMGRSIGIPEWKQQRDQQGTLLQVLQSA
jgi:hypothetical protein